jgi:hypothetical protein
MSSKDQIIPIDNIQNLIFTIGSIQVMLDSDLAQIYGVETKVLNRAVGRNIERFPDNFRFQLTKEEYDNLKFQNATSKKDSLRFQNGTLEKGGALGSQSVTLKVGRGKHRKYLPYVFTEQGVSMLSAVLKSETAIKVSIQIIEAFVEMRKTISNNIDLFQRINNIEQKQIATDVKQIETDNKINLILDAIQEKDAKPEYGIFYENQTFDAYVFVADLIKSAKKSILLIDNYVDESILQLFTKRKKNVEVNIYTKNFSKILKQDLKKHNSQYPAINIKKFTKAHDRFLIIDENTVYHFGASLKDLGKKWFAFSKMELEAMEMITNLGNGGGDE